MSEPAVIEQTNIPGLVNVYLPDGRYFTDVTVGQLSQLAAEESVALAISQAAESPLSGLARRRT